MWNQADIGCVDGNEKAQGKHVRSNGCIDYYMTIYPVFPIQLPESQGSNC